MLDGTEWMTNIMSDSIFRRSLRRSCLMPQQ